MSAHSVTDAERERWEHDGFVVRESVLTPSEIDEMTGACEELCARLAAHSTEAHKVDVSSFYVFETDEPLNVMIKWEPGSRDVIQGVEPLVHLHPVLEQYAWHEGFTVPSRELLDVDEVGLFTEKLNVKRAGVGGAYALHRDLPYWLGDAEDVERMVTVLLTLDEATAANGALEVLPGSHLVDDLPYKESALEFERNEIDPRADGHLGDGARRGSGRERDLLRPEVGPPLGRQLVRAAPAGRAVHVPTRRAARPARHQPGVVRRDAGSNLIGGGSVPERHTDLGAIVVGGAGRC